MFPKSLKIFDPAGERGARALTGAPREGYLPGIARSAAKRRGVLRRNILPEGETMPNSDIQDFLFLAELVHTGEYNIKISWGDVFGVLDKIVDADVRGCCRQALERGYTNGCDADDPFMLLRTPAGGAARAREEVTGRLLEVLRQNPFALNVATLLFLEKSLMMGILGSFYDHAIDFVDTAEERVLISMATSAKFLENEAVGRFFEGRLDAVDDDLAGLYRCLEQPWFLELLLIIKNGYYGNGNFNYIDTLESSFRGSFIEGILELIRRGHLVKLLVRFKPFVEDDKVLEKIQGFVRKTEAEAELRRVYDWLSIGNDLAIGLEFLIGSICFLPGKNEHLGVWLFIAGSSQLLIRPMILIVRKAHLGRLYRRKIKF